MKKGRKLSVIVENHGKFAHEEPDLDLEFGFPVCPECFSADIYCYSVVREKFDGRFGGIFEVSTRYRTCFCKNCDCRFRQIGRKKYYFKPLNLIFWGSILAMIAGLVMPFVFDEGAFLMLFVVGLAACAVYCGIR